MPTKTIQLVPASLLVLIIAFSPRSNAEGWATADFKVPPVKGAVLTMDYPEYWGKPQYQTFDNMTHIEFGPFGPREKPTFLVTLQSAPLVEAMSAENLTDVTKMEVSKFRDVAFETDIPITTANSTHGAYQYFSITDKEKKWGEYDYMTMAVITSGNLLSKCYFFSSDGAPDFGADAIQFIEGIRYMQPPPEEKKEKKEEKKDEQA